MRKPKRTPLPDLPRGYAMSLHPVSRRNRRAAAWRSACAALVCLFNTIARAVAGH